MSCFIFLHSYIFADWNPRRIGAAPCEERSDDALRKIFNFRKKYLGFNSGRIGNCPISKIKQRTVSGLFYFFVGIVIFSRIEPKANQRGAARGA